MNSFFEALVGGSVVNIIGWTLVYFIWQAAAIAIVVLSLLMLLRKNSAAIRYWICCMGLLAMVVCPVISMFYLVTSNALAKSKTDQTISQNNHVPIPLVPTIVPQSIETDPVQDYSVQIANNPSTVAASPGNQSLVSQLESRLSNWLPIWVAIWFVGVLLHFARLAAGIWRIRLWVSHASPVEDSRMIDLFSRVCRSANLHRKIRFLLCDKIKTPAVVGLIWPAVLIPSSLLTGLSCREIELVLSHELAHVKRHDFLINLLQKTAESLLFYHPAVWWISNRISVERENCCDDYAAKTLGDRIALAKALTAMESVRCSDEGLALAATGGALTLRIRRLLMLEPQPVQSAWPMGLIGILLAGICLALVPSLSNVDAMTSPAIEPTAASVPDEEVKANVVPSQRTEIEKKPEVTKQDSKTQIDQRVFADIVLKTELDQETKETTLNMKYSNVIPYSFIPARTAKALDAIKLGELDFTDFKDAEPLTGVTWLIVPNDFVNPMGYIKDGVSHYFLHYLREPTDNPIVPYQGDPLFAPDHLGFYGMNQTKQMKFDVVRIREVDLGIGKPFGPVNALVLKDENSDFGLLGNKWAQEVRGKNGGTLLHAAIGEFRIHPPQQQKQKKPGDKDPGDPGVDIPNKNLSLQKQNFPDIEYSVVANQNQDATNARDNKNLPQFDVIEKNGKIKHIAVNSINVRRTAADLVKHFSATFDRHGARRGVSITNMESIVSALPTKRFDQFVEAQEVTFSLPEGSKSRAAIIGEVIEMNESDDTVEITVTNGKVQWIDSVGVIRAVAAADGGAEQLVISANIGNDEVVLQIKTQRIEPVPDYPHPPVQVTMNVDTGAPKDEEQPPHGSIRYEIFEQSKEENKPMRLKMKWRYDLDRLAKEAEKQTGKKWEAIIWGVDAPNLNLMR